MPLIRHIKIPDALYMQLAVNASAYILECLEAFGVDEIIKLPNMTPNGFIVPKRGIKNYKTIETILKPMIEIIAPGAHSIQSFFCVRYKGKNAQTDREFATEKWHSDIWAGDPANSFVVSIPLLGDINNGIEFAEAKYENIKEYLNYEEGIKSAEIKAILPDRMQMGYATLFDNRCLHRSINSGGWRVSIDFRVIFEAPASCKRIADYVPIQQFGNFIPSQSVEECKAKWQSK